MANAYASYRFWFAWQISTKESVEDLPNTNAIGVSGAGCI